MDNVSVKIQPTMPEKLDVAQGAMGPNEKDVMAQLNASHPLALSEAKYDQHQLSINSNMILSHHGMGAQMKYLMDIRSASKVGRLPFLPSSNIARDVLLGLDETITPADVFGTPDFAEGMYQPHAVMEKKAGIL